MPPIAWHVVTAKDALARLQDRLLEEHLGCYLLGSTSPDIRVITGRSRAETHFYDVNAEDVTSGIPKLLEAHPHLVRLQGRPRAFLSGYITHLATDELWIEQVYRPYFGRNSVLNGTLEANVMDRVLQFYMDSKERVDRDRFKAFYEYIFQADPGDEVKFIDLPTLHRWREVVGNILNQDPTWEGFRSFAVRRFVGRSEVNDEQVRALFESLPEVLERTLKHVSPERVAAFREDAIQCSASAVRRYLS